MTKPKAVICDLDGTLCDTSHRVHYMRQQPKLRDEFHSELVNDPLNTYVRGLLQWARPDHQLILLTCRPNNYELLTIEWLANNSVYYDQLIMRAQYDTRPDAEVKAGIYHYEIEPHYDVKLVLEDKTEVVIMWRDLGLQCWQVQKWD